MRALALAALVLLAGRGQALALLESGVRVAGGEAEGRWLLDLGGEGAPRAFDLRLAPDSAVREGVAARAGPGRGPVGAWATLGALSLQPGAGAGERGWDGLHTVEVRAPRGADDARVALLLVERGPGAEALAWSLALPARLHDPPPGRPALPGLAPAAPPGQEPADSAAAPPLSPMVRAGPPAEPLEPLLPISLGVGLGAAALLLSRRRPPRI